jgi:hypothetical protein
MNPCRCGIAGDNVSYVSHQWLRFISISLKWFTPGCLSQPQDRQWFTKKIALKSAEEKEFLLGRMYAKRI